MNKRERIMAAIRGEPVDRVPAGMWLHDFTMENRPEDLARETCRLLERFDLDFLKPQQRPHCFGQMWGQAFTPSTRKDERPEITQYAVREAGDLANIRRVKGDEGALGEQLEMLTLMHQRGRDHALRLQKQAPEDLERAVTAMAGTLAEFAGACLESGADGIFYATTTANSGDATRAEWERFQREADLTVLDAVRGAPMNILHICGGAIQADWFTDYPVSIVSWATTPGNPSLSQMKQLTGKAALGGMPGKPAFGQQTPEALRQHIHASLDETGGVGHIVGPDCSINPGTPDDLIAAAIDAVRSWRPKQG
jgi:uroporphyrinogen decarboxylase